MRATNISGLALFLSVIFLPACNKEDPDAVVPNNGDSPKMHERTLAIRDLAGKQQATLRFRSTSSELLDDMPLEAFSFTIVTPPATVNNQPELSSSSPDAGSARFSQTHASRKESTPGEIDPAAKAVWVDFVSNTKAEVLSIEVKQKNQPERPYPIPVVARNPGVYSGYSFTLYFGGRAWYYNSNKGVMARWS